MASAEEKEKTQDKGQGRKSALKAGSPGAAAVGGSPGDFPVVEPLCKAASGEVFSPLLRNFPSGEGAASPARTGVLSQGLVVFRLGPRRVPRRALSLRRWIVWAVVLEAGGSREEWDLRLLRAFVLGRV